jgi:hypothetical protein
MRFVQENGSVVLTKAEVRALLVFAPNPSEHPGSVLLSVLVDRFYPHADPDVVRGRVVVTDGHSLLMLEAPGDKGAASTFSTVVPRQFTVPVEKLAEWSKLLTKSSYSLMLGTQINDDYDLEVVPMVVNIPSYQDEPVDWSFWEVASPAVCFVGPEYVNYSGEIPPRKPLTKSLRKVHPTWFDAELLSRLGAVQKATGLKRPGYAPNRKETGCVRLQLGASAPDPDDSTYLMPKPLRFDTPRIEAASCWASGVICGMFSDDREG